MNFLINIISLPFLLRFLFQLSNANPFNPLVGMFAKFTNPVTQPIRRFLPKHQRIDFSSVLIVLAVHTIGAFFRYQALVGIGAFHKFLILGAISALYMASVLYIIAIILMVLMSWIAPNVYSPATELARVITEPILSPLRKLLPSMAGFDFSPMLAILGLMLVQTLGDAIRQFVV